MRKLFKLTQRWQLTACDITASQCIRCKHNFSFLFCRLEKLFFQKSRLQPSTCTHAYIQTKGNTDAAVRQSTHNPTFKPKGTWTQLYSSPYAILHSNQREHCHSCMAVHTQSYSQTKGNTDTAVQQSTHNPESFLQSYNSPSHRYTHPFQGIT